MISTVARCAPIDAVIVVLPTPVAATQPSGETRATCSSLLDQVMPSVSSGASPSVRSCARTCCDAPTRSESSLGSSTPRILGTRACSSMSAACTLAADVSTSTSTSCACTVKPPARRAVTVPSDDTVAASAGTARQATCGNTSAPVASRASSVSAQGIPTTHSFPLARMTNDSKGAGITRTSNVPVTPSTVAEIMALPTPHAVTRPATSTVSTPWSETVQRADGSDTARPSVSTALRVSVIELPVTRRACSPTITTCATGARRTRTAIS